MTDTPAPPRRVFCLAWQQAVGWPLPRAWEQRWRMCRDRAALQRALADLDAIPASHRRAIVVWEAEPAWHEHMDDEQEEAS